MSDKKTAVIVGASSGVGRALANELAANGFSLVLAARSGKDLEYTMLDISNRFDVPVHNYPLDLAGNDQEFETFKTFCFDKLDRVTHLFMVAGMVHDDDNGMASLSLQQQIMATNYTGVVKVSSLFCAEFKKQDYGQLWLFSSIATARSRGANVVYGASKSAMEFYGTGMQHAFAQHKNIQVKIIKLGYIDTALSYGRKLLFKPVSPRSVAQMVVKNLNTSFRASYYPVYWNLITFTLKQLPWAIYKKLNF